MIAPVPVHCFSITVFGIYGHGGHLGHVTSIIATNFRFHVPKKRGGVAQWIGRRISDQGVPGSIPRRCTFRCGLEQVTFTLCLVLVKPRKRLTDDRLGQTVTRLEITLCLMC